MPTLAFDIQWNEGLVRPVEVIAPDGLICTAMFPAPTGAATVETIWVTGNAIMLALNKMLAATPAFQHRAQGVNDGVMATFNMGGVNQFGEKFGLHLMDPLAGGSAAFPNRDGVNAGGPITSPVSAIADVERNEQVAPLFYLHRRLAKDTGGPGRYRGGLAAEVAFSVGGVEEVQALVMTHGAEVPNSRGLNGGYPGATVIQSFGRGGIDNGRPKSTNFEIFGPKPGLMPMTRRDVFAVSWQGGGGYGDPLERDPSDVARDIASGAVSPQAATAVYGVVWNNTVDEPATKRRRDEIRAGRIAGGSGTGETFDGKPLASLGPHLHIGRDARGWFVFSSAGRVLARGSTAWRQGAHRATSDSLRPNTA
ncbi:MAG TPA: hydantoinase B/oxoprolinase family protein [Bauldia sp.]